MFLDGYSIKKASGVQRVFQTMNNVVRDDVTKKAERWRRDLTIRKISDM
jgi:hypothetical protein